MGVEADFTGKIETRDPLEDLYTGEPRKIRRGFGEQGGRPVQLVLFEAGHGKAVPIKKLK